MRLMPFFRWQQPVRGGAHQGVSKPDGCSDLDESGIDRWQCRLACNPETRCRLPYPRRIPNRLGRSHQGEPLGRGWKLGESTPEVLLETPGQRAAGGKCYP
jgi:hypothetical protein